MDYQTKMFSALNELKELEKAPVDSYLWYNLARLAIIVLGYGLANLANAVRENVRVQ